MRATNLLVVLAAVAGPQALLAGCGSSDAGSSSSGDNGALDSGGGGTDGGAHDSGVGGGDTGTSTGSDSGGGSDGGAGHEGGGADAGTGHGDGGTFVPAPHPPLPVLQTAGGPVLANPIVQPVFFSNYDITDQVIAMLEGLPTAKLAGGQTFWTSAVSEYGVGPLTVKPAIKLTETAPTTAQDPATFLQGKLSDPAFAGITPETILAIFYPSTTPLQGSCAAQAHGYGGYHDSFTNGSAQQPFAVSAECTNFGPTTTALDMVTVAGSHEIIEAVTDPYPSTQTAYVGLDSSGAGFAMSVLLQGNAENGDMCTINNGFGRGPSTYPYLLQRGWSNAAVKAGNADPCAPDIRPAQPFVGAYPNMPDTVTVQSQSGPGVVVPVGQSKTIEIKLFTFEPTLDYTVLARQAISVSPPTLTFAWDKTTGNNGDTLHLTITSVSASSAGYESFILQAYLPNATDPQKTAWAGVVTH